MDRYGQVSHVVAGGCGGGAGRADGSLRGHRPQVPDATRSLSRLPKQAKSLGCTRACGDQCVQTWSASLAWLFVRREL